MALDHDVRAKTFLEIGPGRSLNLPIALWLCGADRVICIDVNPYLKSTIVFNNLAYIGSNQESVLALFGQFAAQPLFRERWEKLMLIRDDMKALLALTGIEYRAPADASHMSISDQSVDYYLSFNVLEYIPHDLLTEILQESMRILKHRGLHIHSIDLSDWFAVSDGSITGINFLRFSERQWRWYAGNRYMYQNRLRIDDYQNLFNQAGLNILSITSTVDERSLAALKAGFVVAEQFRGRSHETLAVDHAWIMAGRSGST
jgi:SAM-dependent methyltransferase